VRRDCAEISSSQFRIGICRYPQIISAIKQIADERFEKFKNVLRSADMGDPATFTEDQVNTFRNIFAVVDADNSGHIDAEELEELLFKLSGTRPTKAEVSKFMTYIDEDKSGTIDFNEFLNGLRYFAWLVPAEKKPQHKQTAQVNWVLIAGAAVAAAAIGFAAYSLKKK
jgi:hypothetical protein